MCNKISMRVYEYEGSDDFAGVKEFLHYLRSTIQAESMMTLLNISKKALKKCKEENITYYELLVTRGNGENFFLKKYPIEVLRPIVEPYILKEIETLKILISNYNPNTRMRLKLEDQLSYLEELDMKTIKYSVNKEYFIDKSYFLNLKQTKNIETKC